MKALIIGAAGFVGGHLINHLCSIGNLETFATKLKTEKINNECISKENIYDLDICDDVQTKTVIDIIRPDYIFHLAAQSSVSLSWKEPALTYNINVIGTINILEAIRKLELTTRILLIGSAEEYGKIERDELPINENAPIRPSNPYAVSKASQEAIARLYVQAYGMDIIMVRAFNHIGPGQSAVFAIPDFAKQIVDIENGRKEPVIYTGNLNAKRDFTDVRDIVEGYCKLMRKGIPGEIYNIGSGKSYSIKELLYKMIQISGKDIEVKNDPERLRPVDIPELKADITKIKTHTNWHHNITIDNSLEDILNYWRTLC